ncbi:MAG: ferritin [Actinobacteria bacterium]|nr:ferritin [Actinomycetota bacterium]
MLGEKLQDALNKQLNAELYSSYLYLSMCAYFQSINLKGFANWMYVQAQEELFHATKFFNYINDRGGRVILYKVEGPPTEWKSPQDVFKYTYEHEQKVTGLINDLVNLSKAESDHATNIFLQWFVTEQIEEETSANDILQKLKMIGEGGPGLFMIDQELAKRVFTMPASGEGSQDKG